MNQSTTPAKTKSPKQIFQTLGRLLRAFYSHEDEKAFPWLPILWISALILAGVVLWGLFFNWGSVPIDYMDWAEVWGARMQAWRDALLHNTLPFHLNDPAAVRNGTDRYFATADMISTPQVILLRWLEVGQYSLVNNLLLYAVATWFLLKIRRKYQLSLFAFSMMFLLFHFNGHIVTHLSVGHLNWGGYYLFPAFVLFLLELFEEKQGWPWVAKMAFLLFFIFMQGSFHQLVWSLITLGILAVIRWRQFFVVMETIIAAILLSLPRILPVLFLELEGPRGIDFLGGYPTLWDLVRSLIYNSTPDMGMPRQVLESSLGYWEFDSFVGIGGLLFLAFGGLWLLVWHYRNKKFPHLLVPMAVLTIMAISDNYLTVLFHHPILASTERVSARMFELVLVMLIILASIYYQRFVKQYSIPFYLHLLQLGLLGWVAWDMLYHTLRWSVNSAFAAFPFTDRDLVSLHISNHPDPQYYTQMAVGLGVSLLTMAFLLWVGRKRKA